MKKTKIVGLSLVIIGLSLFTYSVFGYHAYAHNKCHHVCDDKPTPTIVVPCGEIVNDDYRPCVTPTPSLTHTPTATPTPTIVFTGVSDGRSDGGSSNPGETQPSHPSCTIPFNAPILQGFEVKGSGSVTFSWWGVPNIDKYSIIYGYTPDSLIYGEDNIPSTSTSITLNSLQKGSHVWAVVTGWKGQCAESSNELDPIVR